MVWLHFSALPLSLLYASSNQRVLFKYQDTLFFAKMKHNKINGKNLMHFYYFKVHIRIYWTEEKTFASRIIKIGR